MDEVICPYCREKAKLVTGKRLYPQRKDLEHKNFWVCWKCKAYVGCHPPNKKYNRNGTEPLGTPAKLTLRRARKGVHDLFDLLWIHKKMDRDEAYKFLAIRLGIPKNKCHIAMFDEKTCKKAKEVLKNLALIFTEKDHEHVSSHKKAVNRRRIEQSKR